MQGNCTAHLLRGICVKIVTFLPEAEAGESNALQQNGDKMLLLCLSSLYSGMGL